MKNQMSKALEVSTTDGAVTAHPVLSGCVPAVLRGWGEPAVQLGRVIRGCIQAQHHQSWRINSCSSPQSCKVPGDSCPQTKLINTSEEMSDWLGKPDTPKLLLTGARISPSPQWCCSNSSSLWTSMSFLHSSILPWAFHTSLLSWLYAASPLHLHLALSILICFLKAGL